MPAKFWPTKKPPRSHLAVAMPLVPRFRRWKLTEPQAVLDLEGEIVSGHADRHVVRVALGRGRHRLAAFLKREHRVRLRDRLASWWHGFGAISLAEREAKTLAELRKAGVPTPRVLACGECDDRAFLLLAAVRGTMDLRRFLHRMGAALADHRRTRIARWLGDIVARVHNAGYDAPDLLSKHVLIDPQSLAITLLDWPRARRYSQISFHRAARDLGQLHASLAGSLATPRDRLRCLRAYWQARGGKDGCKLRSLVALTERAARRSLRRRSVRELLRPPVEERPQNLRWIDGERLCVTPAFWNACGGHPPAWLTAAAARPASERRTESVFWRERQLTLQRWPAESSARRWFARILGRRIESAETDQAGLLFRLRRYGVPAPRVLAFGRRDDGSGFLLTRPIPQTRVVADWLRTYSPRRDSILLRLGRMLRRLHAAGRRLEGRIDLLGLHRDRTPVLLAIPPQSMPQPAGRWPYHDLGQIVRSLRLTDADAARLVRGYLGNEASKDRSRELAAELRGQLPAAREVPHA